LRKKLTIEKQNSRRHTQAIIAVLFTDNLVATEQNVKLHKMSSMDNREFSKNDLFLIDCVE